MTVLTTAMRDGELFFYHGHYTTAGDRATTFKHLRDGRVILTKGIMRRSHFDEHETFTAPAVIPIPAKKNYVLTALVDDTIVSCVHILQGDEQAPPVLD